MKYECEVPRWNMNVKHQDEIWMWSTKMKYECKAPRWNTKYKHIATFFPCIIRCPSSISLPLLLSLFPLIPFSLLYIHFKYRPLRCPISNIHGRLSFVNQQYLAAIDSHINSYINELNRGKWEKGGNAKGK